MVGHVVIPIERLLAEADSGLDGLRVLWIEGAVVELKIDVIHGGDDTVDVGL